MALHEDADMDAQLARTLIGTLVGSADLGEALATAQLGQQLWWDEVGSWLSGQLDA